MGNVRGSRPRSADDGGLVMSSSRSFAAVAVIAVVAVFGSVGAASASPPRSEPVPVPDQFTVEGICSFTVQIDVLMNREKITTFSNGTQLITGAVKMRLTNTSKPDNSVVLNP